MDNLLPIEYLTILKTKMRGKRGQENKNTTRKDKKKKCFP
jgi:hypothetical protein